MSGIHPPDSEIAAHANWAADRIAAEPFGPPLYLQRHEKAALVKWFRAAAGWSGDRPDGGDAA